jgi:RNA polymerase sigma-70 factor, ECF subfamily
MTSLWPVKSTASATAALSFAAAAERHLDDVYRYLLYLTKNGSLAEELTGETFERALRAWGRFDPRRGTPKTWLCQLARTTALDRLRSEARRRNREKQYVQQNGQPAVEPQDESRLSPELERALETLSAADREIVALRVLLELDDAEAARVLDISRSAASTRLNRALKRLKERMTADAVA